MSDTIPVVVLTSPRPQVCLHDTVENLLQAGFTNIHIFHDNEQRGPWGAYQWVMRECMRTFFDIPAALIVEDDIAICLNTHDYLRDTLRCKLTDQVGIISLYLAKFTQDKLWPNEEGTLLKLANDGISVCGALAYFWNLNVLKKISVAEDINRENVLGTDIYIPQWLRKHGYDVLFHSPSLVQHADNGRSTYENAHDYYFRHADPWVGKVDVIKFMKNNSNTNV